MKHLIHNKLHFFTRSRLVTQVLAGFGRYHILRWMFFPLLPFCIYVLILMNRSVAFPFRAISQALRSGFTFVLPILVVTGFIALWLPGWWGRMLGFSYVMALFGFALAGIWASGQSEYYIMGGLLPFVDGSSYLNDARRLLEGGLMTGFSSWRPLFPALMAPVLWLSGQNLQLSLGILVAVVAVCCYLLVRAVQRTHGTLPAVLVLVVTFMYYRRFSGAMVAENLGFAFGALGFALLWGAASSRLKIGGLVRKQLQLQIIGGIFFISLALFTRLGAFFILPLLAVWAGWFLRKKQKRFNWGAFGWSTAAAAGALLVYWLASLLFAVGPRTPLDYYSKIFYDLVTGYPKKMGQVYEDYPQLAELPAEEQPSIIYELAFTRLRQQPLDILRGAVKQLGVMFSDSWYAAYSYLKSETYIWITRIIYITMYTLCLLALVGWLRKRGDGLSLLLFAVFAGTLLSVPFVPPALHNRIRLYAATAHIFALLPALGLHYLLQLLKLDKLLAQKPEGTQPFAGVVLPFSFWMGLGILAFMLVGSLGLRLFSRPAQVAAPSCPQGTRAAVARLAHGSRVNVIKEDVLQIDWLPDFHNGRFRQYIHSMPYYDAIAEIEAVEEPPATVFNALDLLSGDEIFVIVDRALMPDEPGVLGLCGNYSPNPLVEKYHFFYPLSVEVLTP